MIECTPESSRCYSVVLITARTCTAILCNSCGGTFAAYPAILTVCTTFPKLPRNISLQWPHTWLTTIYTRSWAALRGWDPPPYDRSNTVCSLIRGSHRRGLLTPLVITVHWSYSDFKAYKLIQWTPERRHGYPRLLVPHVMHNLSDDYVNNASSIYLQLDIAVSSSSTIPSITNKSWPLPSPLSFCYTDNKENQIFLIYKEI
jgi:hypothetical protein